MEAGEVRVKTEPCETDFTSTEVELEMELSLDDANVKDVPWDDGVVKTEPLEACGKNLLFDCVKEEQIDPPDRVKDECLEEIVSDMNMAPAAGLCTGQAMSVKAELIDCVKKEPPDHVKDESRSEEVVSDMNMAPGELFVGQVKDESEVCNTKVEPPVFTGQDVGDGLVFEPVPSPKPAQKQRNMLQAAKVQPPKKKFIANPKTAAKTNKPAKMVAVPSNEKNNYDQDLYQCFQCNYTSNSKENLQAHQKKHTVVMNTNPYKCDECGFASEYKTCLVRHSVTHNTEAELYKCDLCSYATTTKNHLTVHVRKHTGEKPFKCKHCNYAGSQIGSLIVHQKKHDKKELFKCSQCNYACDEKRILEDHKRKHTGEKPYKCDQCSYTGSQLGHLYQHQLSHSHTTHGIYKCDQCSFSCARIDDFLKHKVIHNNVKLYKCSQCSFSGDRNWELKVHEKEHSGGITHKCGQCSYVTIRRSNLILHESRHAGVKPYQKSQSGYAARKSKLKDQKMRYYEYTDKDVEAASSSATADQRCGKADQTHAKQDP